MTTMMMMMKRSKQAQRKVWRRQEVALGLSRVVVSQGNEMKRNDDLEQQEQQPCVISEMLPTSLLS